MLLQTCKLHELHFPRSIFYTPPHRHTSCGAPMAGTKLQLNGSTVRDRSIQRPIAPRAEALSPSHIALLFSETIEMSCKQNSINARTQPNSSTQLVICKHTNIAVSCMYVSLDCVEFLNTFMYLLSLAICVVLYHMSNAI